jgi:putative ABC transport system permease protein
MDPSSRRTVLKFTTSCRNVWDVFLAFREMRRAGVRFGLLIAAVSLLLFLILFQQALQSSLITSFIGALQRQSAPVLVYTTDAQRAPFGSVITPELERRIKGVDVIDDSARIGVGSFTVEVDGGGESSVTFFGYEKPDLGGPASLTEGRFPANAAEAVGSAPDFTLGQRVSVVPTGAAEAISVTVVGLAEDAELLVTPTLFVAYATYVDAVQAANPDARVVLPNLIGVRPAAGTSDADLVTALNAVSDDVDALTRAQAADESPGVAQVRQSFQIIFLLYGLVVPLITGLFFLIITFQKASSLTLLRAIGARSGLLVRSLLVQVVVVVGGGIVLGTALFAPLSGVSLGTLALKFDWGTVAFWAALLLGLGLLSALVAARRVLAIDPIEATTGGEQR